MLELEHGFRVLDVHVRLDADRVGDAHDAGTARTGGTAGRRPGRQGGGRREAGRGDGPGGRRQSVRDRSGGRSVGAERLQRELRQAGIVRAAVFPGPREGGYVAANNAVARASVDRPLVALARIAGVRDPRETATARLRNLAASREDHHTDPEAVERYAYDDRFQGFKLNPGVDGLPDAAVLDRLEAVDRPVVVHGGRAFPPEAVERALLGRSFPVVLAHFGGYPLDRAAMGRAIDLLGEYDNLYLDTSAVRYRAVLERALREHPDRVLFGSGAPAVHPSVAVMELLTLDVPEDRMRRAFSKNAARVIPGLAQASA